MRAVFGRAIAPAAAALEHMDDAADDTAVVHPLDAAHIRRQMRFDPLPLFIAQPKQIPAHDPDPLPKTNQDRIVTAEKLMSSDPSSVACQPACHSELARLENRGYRVTHGQCGELPILGHIISVGTNRENVPL